MLANSADSNQTAPMEQSDLGLHCSFMRVCLNMQDKYHGGVCCRPSQSATVRAKVRVDRDNGQQYQLGR